MPEDAGEGIQLKEPVGEGLNPRMYMPRCVRDVI